MYGRLHFSGSFVEALLGMFLKVHRLKCTSILHENLPSTKSNTVWTLDAVCSIHWPLVMTHFHMPRHGNMGNGLCAAVEGLPLFSPWFLLYCSFLSSLVSITLPDSTNRLFVFLELSLCRYVFFICQVGLILTFDRSWYRSPPTGSCTGGVFRTCVSYNMGAR